MNPFSSRALFFSSFSSARSFHGPTVNNVTDAEPLRNIVHELHVANVALNVAFGVTNCDMLVAENDDVSVHLRQGFNASSAPHAFLR
ncbi:hypothetical protein L596_016012 [Steinernema carpocapsae]|uniref:Uncharacterized protein n=1 Tax=Steinernema carpocapsae TaxID=34508 RepID=A0A4U5NHJ1_STECR|nr:hypothetical protein L596_016012 [Steinernema carpocapsae]